MSGVTDPADLGVLAAGALLRSRDLSAVELLAACQRRVAERNGGPPTFDGGPAAVNAWARLYPELAGEQARAADERRSQDGDEAPLLCGIPVGLKDLFAVAGLPLTASSRVLAGQIAERSAAAWQRLAGPGMVLVGHTHTHEFAAGGTTDQVGNPWALDRAPGGSSGGSAAALASGMVPAALGTDTAGSLRIPAALSGVSTVKPTHGLIPLGGVIPLAPTLDHAGPMARSLADCGALLTALTAGPAEVSPLLPPPAPPGPFPVRARSGPRPLHGVTIAVTDRPERAGLDPDVAEILDHAVTAVARLGARVRSLPAAPDLPGPELNAVLLTEAGAYHRRHRDAAAGYRISIREFVAASAAFTSAESYLAAQAHRTRVTAGWEDWFAGHQVDALLEPTVCGTAPPRGPGYDSGQLAGDGDLMIRLTATWNATGFPVASLPGGLGRRSGLPVGVSLAAPRGADARVLQIGIDLQEHALPPLGVVEPRAPG
jgi:aspartyl-tRNA(Asn)/glutamyl-tRNA(Gln) amidotransferase subunit A